MIPINNIALGTLPPERVKNASGLFNLTRNLGGAVGLAALTTMLNDRTDLHLARLHESVTWSRRAGLEMLNNLTQQFSSYGSDAQQMALKQLNAIVHRQGVVMAFADVFLVLTVLFVGLAVLSVLIRRPPTNAPDRRRALSSVPNCSGGEFQSRPRCSIRAQDGRWVVTTTWKPLAPVGHTITVARMLGSVGR